MIDIDKNLELFYEREENKEDTYIGAISKHECVVDGWFVIELLEEVKQLREELAQTREYLWWCYDNYRFDSHPMVGADWNFIGNLLGADMESEEE